MSGETQILDGKWLAKQVQASIKHEVDSLTSTGNRPPGLGVILVGDNPASQRYVANKGKAALNCGFKTYDQKLSAAASHEEVYSAILSFNHNPDVDGILLQLPLPKHLDQNPLLDSIDPHKDADGLHPLNQGLMLRGEGTLRSCTPLGVMKLIDLAYSGIIPSAETALEEDLEEVNLSGKRAVVIGRSILVGKPVACMLLERNATVVLAHSKTRDLSSIVRECDIVVAAVGVPHLVKGDWIKNGAVVIDVGINQLPDKSLSGDVDFEGARPRASAITPVPGGVGPMTITMLIRNTLEAYKSRILR